MSYTELPGGLTPGHICPAPPDPYVAIASLTRMLEKAQRELELERERSKLFINQCRKLIKSPPMTAAKRRASRLPDLREPA